MRWEYNHSLIHITNSDKMVKYSIIILITQLLLWGCCRSERSILESFYKALDGDKWEHKENWLSDKPLNEWYGITTDEKGKVVKIQLSDTMTGKVPANLKHLKKLQSLHLDCMAGGIRLEVNNYPSLKELELSGNVEKVSVENCSELEKLSLTSRYFDAFHVDSCPKLSSLELIGHNISDTTKRELDLSPFPKLSELKIYHLALDQLHINTCFNLKKIEIDSCQLQELNLSSCANLEYLKVSGNDSLHALDLSRCMKLDTLNVRGNSITQLDVSQCKGLKYLDCSRNTILSKLELNNPLLCTLDCSFNQLDTLDIGKHEELQYLYCYFNHLETLDISQYKKLRYLHCFDNFISELDISKCEELESLDCHRNCILKLELNTPKLESLNCCRNSISKLDVSKCKKLECLICSRNGISKLDVSECKELVYLFCSRNNISKLKLNNPKLHTLDCSLNNLSTLDISNGKDLKYLDCSYHSLKAIWVWDGFDPSTFDEWLVPEGVECKIKQ